MHLIAEFTPADDAMEKTAAVYGGTRFNSLNAAIRAVNPLTAGTIIIDTHGNASRVNMVSGRMIDNNANTVAFAAGANGKVRNVHLLACCVAAGLNTNANHVMKSLADGLRTATQGASVYGYDQSVYIISGNWFRRGYTAVGRPVVNHGVIVGSR